MRRAKLPPHIVAALIEADRDMLTSSCQSNFPVYEIAHVTVSKIVRADCFYVGLFCDEDTITFPYRFEDSGSDAPNAHPYDADKISAWVREHRCPYWYVLHGDEVSDKGFASQADKQAYDCLSVPIFDIAHEGRRRVTGTILALAYEARVYTEDTVDAMEWIAESIATTLRSKMRRQQLDSTPLDASVTANARIINMVSRRLGDIRYKAKALAASVQDADPLTNRALSALLTECEQARSDILELAG